MRTSATAFNALSRHNVHLLERNPWRETPGTFAAAFAALERYHHEEDVIGPRCGRDFGRFRSLARLCWSAHLSRPRRLSVLVGLCRCPGWRADAPMLLAYPALLGRLCLARAPRAHLRLINRSLVFGHETVMPVLSPLVRHEEVNGSRSVAVRGPSLTRGGPSAPKAVFRAKTTW